MRRETGSDTNPGQLHGGKDEPCAMVTREQDSPSLHLYTAQNQMVDDGGGQRTGRHFHNMALQGRAVFATSNLHPPISPRPGLPLPRGFAILI